MAFIIVEYDKMWPSSVAGNSIIEKLDSMGSTIEKKHLIYPDAGHNLFIFPYIPSLDLPVTMAAGWSLSGGTVQGNAIAQKASQHEMLDFLEKHMQEKKDKE